MSTVYKKPLSLTNVELKFIDLLQPHQIVPSAPKKYNVFLLLHIKDDAESIELIKNTISQIAKENNTKIDEDKLTFFKHPNHPKSLAEDGTPYNPEHYTLKCSTVYKPTLCDRDAKEVDVDSLQAKALFFPGMFANIETKLGYSKHYNTISAYLVGVQSCETGRKQQAFTSNFKALDDDNSDEKDTKKKKFNIDDI